MKARYKSFLYQIYGLKADRLFENIEYDSYEDGELQSSYQIFHEFN